MGKRKPAKKKPRKKPQPKRRKSTTRCDLYNKDCREVLDTMPAKYIDTVICDPPYGLGFMGKDWDHSVPGVGFWTQIIRVCKPGAMLLAFGGTRTHHRLMCAIEDAGWEIRDCMMWLYGSGSPKSASISKQLDKKAGATREVVGKYVHPSRGADWVDFPSSTGEKKTGVAYGDYSPNSRSVTTPATEAAKLWDGYGTALKPAWEPIIVAMKPLEGTFAQNAMEHGVAGLNIDGGRIGHNEGREAVLELKPSGRWPANLLLQHHPECHPDCPVGMLDRQSGVSSDRPAKAALSGEGTGDGKSKGLFGMGSTARCGYQSTGGASRFFYTAKASKKERNHGLEGLKKKYLATMGRGIGAREHSPDEKGAWVQNNHPTVKPLKIMEYLCLLTRTPTGGIVLDPFMGSGTTGIACARTGRKFIGMENDKEHGYYRIARERIRKAYREAKRKTC